MLTAVTCFCSTESNWLFACCDLRLHCHIGLQYQNTAQCPVQLHKTSISWHLWLYSWQLPTTSKWQTKHQSKKPTPPLIGRLQFNWLIIVGLLLLIRSVIVKIMLQFGFPAIRTLVYFWQAAQIRMIRIVTQTAMTAAAFHGDEGTNLVQKHVKCNTLRSDCMKDG